MIGQHTIHLFGERIAPVPGSQACLYVPHMDLPVLGGNCRCGDCGSVTLNQDPVHLCVSQHRIEFSQNTGGQGGESLLRSHQVEIDVRLNIEDLQHLIQHFTMLRRDTHTNVELVWTPLQSLDHRRHLDRLGSSSHDEHHSHPRVSTGLGDVHYPSSSTR